MSVSSSTTTRPKLEQQQKNLHYHIQQAVTTKELLQRFKQSINRALPDFKGHLPRPEQIKTRLSVAESASKELDLRHNRPSFITSVRNGYSTFPGVNLRFDATKLGTMLHKENGGVGTDNGDNYNEGLEYDEMTADRDRSSNANKCANRVGSKKNTFSQGNISGSYISSRPNVYHPSVKRMNEDQFKQEQQHPHNKSPFYSLLPMSGGVKKGKAYTNNEIYYNNLGGNDNYNDINSSATNKNESIATSSDVAPINAVSSCNIDKGNDNQISIRNNGSYDNIGKNGDNNEIAQVKKEFTRMISRPTTPEDLFDQQVKQKQWERRQPQKSPISLQYHKPQGTMTQGRAQTEREAAFEFHPDLLIPPSLLTPSRARRYYSQHQQVLYDAKDNSFHFPTFTEESKTYHSGARWDEMSQLANSPILIYGKRVGVKRPVGSENDKNPIRMVELMRRVNIQNCCR